MKNKNGKIKVKMFEEIKENLKGQNLKTFISSTYDFFKNNLMKAFLVLCLISIILGALGINIVVEGVRNANAAQDAVQNASYIQIYFSNIKNIFVVILSGIVPYIYAPVVAMFSVITLELSKFATIIVDKGYFMATLIYIVPMILNLCIMNMAVALGIYICKTRTNKNKLENVNDDASYTKLKMELYATLRKDKKKQAIENKEKEKKAKLEKKNIKLDYFQIVSITGILFVLQIIASLFEFIIIY